MKKLKLKSEFESVWIKDPFGPNQLWTKEIPESMYAHLANHGYSQLFEEDVQTVTVKATPVKGKTTEEETIVIKFPEK
jgi:hypothetical protein